MGKQAPFEKLLMITWKYTCKRITSDCTEKYPFGRKSFQDYIYVRVISLKHNIKYWWIWLEQLFLRQNIKVQAIKGVKK